MAVARTQARMPRWMIDSQCPLRRDKAADCRVVWSTVIMTAACPEHEPPQDARTEPLGRIMSGLDLRQVAKALAAARTEILERWLESTSEQPFHAGRRASAVADHVPRLFDALVKVLERTGNQPVTAASPLDDPDVLASAQDHARSRFEQGLQPADVVTEFRLLRQEIGRALWRRLRDDTPAGTVAGAELLVHDALDGAITLALHALTTHIEEVREDFLATTLHDTRQPLTSIKGFHQLIVRQLDQPDLDQNRIRNHLQRATDEVDRMSALLDTLTDVSRLALGRLTLQIVAVDLADLLRRAVDWIGYRQCNVNAFDSICQRMHWASGTKRCSTVCLVICCLTR
jgi:signal transduction histidine kinase